MTDQQLLEYEALAGVAVDADADELECAWAIDALVAEVRRLREERGAMVREWREDYGPLLAREAQLEREVGRLRERVDYLEGWQKGAEEGADRARCEVEFWKARAAALSRGQ